MRKRQPTQATEEGVVKRGQKGDARKTLESTLAKAGVLDFGDDITSLRKSKQ